MEDLFAQLSQEAEHLHTLTGQAARQLRDLSRRLELILSQIHKNIPIRDSAFTEDFTAFCAELRRQTDHALTQWTQLREQSRQQFTQKNYPSVLQAKGFALHAKTLSRTCDDFTTAYDAFSALYKNYTLSKLPVWILNTCCEDINHLAGKILFLSREMSKYSDRVRQGIAHAHR